MQTSLDTLSPTTCPHRAAAQLYVPMPRRIVVQDRLLDGAPAVVLYYGDKEVTFDEAALFPFAHALAGADHFTTAQAQSWAPQADPAVVDDCLAVLQAEGILATGQRPAFVPAARSRPAPLPQGSTGPGRSWADEAAQIGRDLLGHPIAPAHLELVIPVFRLAHPALDADGRQVGEANVFPRALRLERATDWQVCTYAGTRHMADRPMNVTALKAMRAHWPEMMAALALIRTACLRRCGLALDAPLTLGQIERLAIAVLSVPTWALMRPRNPVANGRLDPALSSLFRVTDGLRMAAHQMMFVPVGEPVTPPEQVVTAADMHAYAERAMSFHSETGVCAGPSHFVAEFLSVLIEGKPPVFGAGGHIGPAMAEALEGLDAAMDYGFEALAAHAAAFSVWPHMGAACQALTSLATTLPDSAAHFRSAMADLARQLDTQSYLGRADWRQSRLDAYGDMYRNARHAAGLPDGPSLQAALAALRSTDARLAKDLFQGLTQALPGVAAATLAEMATILADFALQTQAHLRLAGRDQARLAGRLNRPAAPAFTARDLTLHTALQSDAALRLPFLPDALHALTGLQLSITQSHITVTPATVPRPSPGHPGENRANRA